MENLNLTEKIILITVVVFVGINILTVLIKKIRNAKNNRNITRGNQ